MMPGNTYYDVVVAALRSSPAIRALGFRDGENDIRWYGKGADHHDLMQMTKPTWTIHSSAGRSEGYEGVNIHFESRGYGSFQIDCELTPRLGGEKKKDQAAIAPLRQIKIAVTQNLREVLLTGLRAFAGGPRPIVPRPQTAVTERGPGLPRVIPSEQSIEPPAQPPARSHSQDRRNRMDAQPPTQHTHQSNLAVGIDVAKDKLDLARSDTDRARSYANDAAGVAAIVKELAEGKPAIIVVEATGGYERLILDALLEAQLPVALVHPGRVRQFALGLGWLAKTDPIDARMLMRFGQLAAPRLAQRRSANHVELEALVVCRRQLGMTRAQQSNRLGTTHSKSARKAIEKVIAALDKQIESLDKQIRDLIDADDDFKHLDGLLQSVPGVGPALSATLATQLSELGEADRRQVSALAGVAPFNRDSGRKSGMRSIRGGRVSVRCVLYMSAVSAIRCNPVIRAFSERLKKAGKASKVRIVACMRKLLTLLNAMVRGGLRWEELDALKKLANQG